MNKLLGQRLTFTGKRGKVGLARGTAKNYVTCVTEIKLNGEIVKDHSWFEWDKRMHRIPKDREFKFVATVVQYISLDENHAQIIKYKFDKVRSVEELA
jgi:hypothetical protein